MLVVGAVFLVVLWPSLIGRTSFVAGDIVLARAPWNEYQIDDAPTHLPLGDTIDARLSRADETRGRLLDGDFPEWEPYSNGGTPLLTLPNEGFLNPISWPLLILEPEHGAVWSKLLELTIVVAGMWALCRRLGLPTIAGLTAGVTYGFSAFQLAWTNWPQTAVGAFIPMTFWAAERLLQERRLTAAAPLTLSLAFQVTGGFPAVVAYMIYPLCAYVALRLLADTAREAGNDKRFGAALLANTRVGLIFSFGLVSGIAIVAVQLLPLARFLESMDLSYRANRGTSGIPMKALVTAAIPDALGDAVDDRWYGPLNVIEAHSFLGVVPLILIACAVLLHVDSRSALARWFFPALLAYLTVVIFAKTSLTGTFGSLPGVAGSALGRARSIWAFSASVVAAYGVAAVWGLERRPSTMRRFLTLSALMIGLSVLAIASRRVLSTARAEGSFEHVQGSVTLAILVASVATVAIALPLLSSRFSPRITALVLLALAGLQGGSTAKHFWPETPADQFVPETPAHEFLAATQGHNRVALDRLTLYAGTTTFFELRLPTGHGFHADNWADLVRAVDSRAFDNSRTFSFLALTDPEAMHSPILDRMGVGLAAIAIRYPIYGSGAPLSVPTAAEQLTQEPLTTRFVADGVRAIGLWIDAGPPAEPTIVAIDIELRQGDTVVSSSRRIVAAVSDVPFTIPIAAEALDADEAIELSISLRGDNPNVSIRTDALGAPAVVLTEPVDDDLSMVFSDGLAIYERENAMDRIRWTPNSLVIEDASSRVQALAAGVPHDTVILSTDPGPERPATPGGSGTVTAIDESDPDRIEIETKATSSGWVTVADSIQFEWRATVDGRMVEVVDADHAFGAVWVPPGQHTVVFEHIEPEGATGRLVSAATVLILVAVWIASKLRTSQRAQPGLE